MLPDLTTPDTCPTCGERKSHDVRQLGTLALLGRVYKCGAAVSTNAAGAWFTTLVCPKATHIIAELRAENVRLGDRNVLLATELQAIADAAEWTLLPGNNFIGPMRRFAQLALDLAVEALAGTPAEAPAEPNHGQAGLELPAAEHVGERSLGTA